MPQPTARILTLADAVVAAINTLGLPPEHPGAAAVRGYGFGLAAASINALRVIVSPKDYEGENANEFEMTQNYMIQVQVLKIVNKHNSAMIDPYLNLAIKIARLFPQESQLTLGSDRLLVVGNRFSSLLMLPPETDDDMAEASGRFDSRLELVFKELGRSKSEAT